MVCHRESKALCLIKYSACLVRCYFPKTPCVRLASVQNTLRKNEVKILLFVVNRRCAESVQKRTLFWTVFLTKVPFKPVDIIKIERLKHLATAVATDGGKPSPQEEAEYAENRQELISSQELSGQLPNFVRACSNLMEVRRDMQTLFGDYKGRREYIRQELTLLLTGAVPRDLFQEVVTATDLSNLATLPADIQKKGKEGADCFVYLFCVENSIKRIHYSGYGWAVYGHTTGC